MMRSMMSLALAACARRDDLFAGAGAIASADPTAAASIGRWHARCDALRHSLRHVDGLEKARQLVAAAEAEAKKRNWKMNIAVVDTNGEPVLFERMEGAQIASGSISIGKARTSARFRRESRAFYNAYERRSHLCRHARPDADGEPRRLPAGRGWQADRRDRDAAAAPATRTR